GLEHVLDGHRPAAVLAGQDAAAVEEDGRHVDPGQADDGPRDGLVAGADGDDGIEGVAGRRQFDGVGDQLAADQRGLHALVAHADGVIDRHRVELQGRAPGVAHTLLDVLGQFPQVVVAWLGLGPGVGDADQRALEVLVVEAGGPEHRPMGGAVGSLGDDAAPQLAAGRLYQEHHVPSRRRDETVMGSGPRAAKLSWEYSSGAGKGTRPAPAPPGSRRRAGSAFQRVVGRFLGDLDVVGMALAVPGLGNPHEAAVGPQALDVGGTAVAHAGPQPADQLVHRLRQRTAVGNAALDALGHELGGVILEVAVAGPRLHGAQRAHAPVDLVGAALVDLQFAGALLGAG